MEKSVHEIMDICLMAGSIMLKNGAETYRVEETMTRIALAFSIQNTHAFVTPTGIILSVEGSSEHLGETKFVRITERTVDLNKISLVNEISRQVGRGELTLEETKRELKTAERAHFIYPLWSQIVAAAFVSGCFLIMFQGKWSDFIPAFISGGIGYAVYSLFQRFVKVKFFSEVLAAFCIGIVAVGFVRLGAGSQLDNIIVGSVMPLVPGVLITNAVRDLMAGHLISGLSRGAEALLTATAIGTGIAVVITLL